MVPYFGRHGAKQYIHGKPIKLGDKLWVIASPLGYYIRFRQYSGKNSQLSEYGNDGLGAVAVAHLVQFLPAPNNDHSKYPPVMDTFFTLPGLLRHLREKPIAATGTMRPCRMENSFLKSVDEVGKTERGSSGIAVQTSSSIAAIRCKDNNVVNALCTYVGKNEQQNAKRYSQTEEKHRHTSA